jgi:DNA-directed RNA polymerase subunit alpha
MYAIHLPEISKSDENATQGTFVVEPLHRGYGVTLGNSMRRVLLSSLAGGAVTAFSVEGASHEFTSLEGVKEDVVQITLNLKRLRFRVYNDEPQTVTLKKKGKGEVTGADISGSADVEVANPDQVIATLDNDKTELNMTLQVEKGRGYVPVDERHEQLPVGMIAIDALFSPVDRVRYKVENTRVGQITDLDRLSLDIITDGTITPSQAMQQAADILVNQFSVLAGTEGSGALEHSWEDGDELAVSIEDLQLSSRTTNALQKNEITTVKDLVQLNESELKGLQGFGDKAYEEVTSKLKELELQ